MLKWRHSDKNERMEELCCISALGQISAKEQQELDAHLLDCGECRKLKQEFEQIVYRDLSGVAADRFAAASPSTVTLDDPTGLLSRVLERASQEQIHTVPTPMSDAKGQAPWWDRVFKPIVMRPLLWSLAGTGATCLVVISLHVKSPRLAPVARSQTTPQIVQAHPDLARQNGLIEQWKNEALAKSQEAKTLRLQVDQLRADEAAKASALDRLQTTYQNTLSTQASLEHQMAENDLKAKQLTSELEGAQTILAQERRDNLGLRAQLDETSNSPYQVRQKERARDQAPSNSLPDATNTAAAVTDADAKELFGARDLHIVDVYDIDRSGKTKRTYGRMYYVDRRLLLFYAFDLANKKKDRTLASFQAWGYRHPNSSKPENLGLFRVDNASQNRWVLRVSNVDVLARIDTVFVTLEPPHGSPYPRGQKLLFASLMGPANHP